MASRSRWADIYTLKMHVHAHSSHSAASDYKILIGRYVKKKKNRTALALKRDSFYLKDGWVPFKCHLGPTSALPTPQRNEGKINLCNSSAESLQNQNDAGSAQNDKKKKDDACCQAADNTTHHTATVTVATHKREAQMRRMCSTAAR